MIALAIFFPTFSIYGFMLLELTGVIFVLYHELYSTKKSDIDKFNLELDNYCDYYIRRYETYNSQNFGRIVNLPENKGLEISDIRKKLLNDDPNYKANNDRVLKNRETKKKNKIPYAHYSNYQTIAKQLLRFFLVPNSDPVNKVSISISDGDVPPPAYPLLPEITMLKNSILVLGYYLILNGFALQLISQIFKDCNNEKNIIVESATENNNGNEKEIILLDTFKFKEDENDEKSDDSEELIKIETKKSESSGIGNKTSKF